MPKNTDYQILDLWSPWPPASLSKKYNFGALLSSRQLELDEVTIWHRLKPRTIAALPEAFAFALRERREFINGICFLCNPEKCINYFPAQERARNKIVQLKTANDLGILTPDTIFTSDAEAATALEERILYKPLSWMSSQDGDILFSNTVSKKSLLDNKKAIAIAPGIYQKYTEKKCEYRVTILDSDIFIVRIYSQSSANSQIDWRRDQDNLKYEKAELPSNYVNKLMQLMCNLGLRYGAIDLIEKPNGELIFLEVNPAGNWLWLEDELELPISRLIAEKLAQI